MSHIPNSAMPHAAPSNAQEGGESAGRGRFDQVAEMVREHPRAAAAIGVAAAASLAAAAAIPAIRSRAGPGRKDGKKAGAKSR